MNSSQITGEAGPDDSQFCDFPDLKAVSGRPFAILRSGGGLRDRAALPKAANWRKFASNAGLILRRGICRMTEFARESGKQDAQDSAANEPSSGEDKKRCIYCDSEIPKRANICVVCKSDQSQYKNWLIAAGGLTGLVTFFASAVSFLIVNTIDIYERIHWAERLSVYNLRIESQSQFSLIFSNSGKYPIFVDQIVIKWQHGVFSVKIGRQVEPNQFIYIDEAEKEPTKVKFLYSHAAVYFNIDGIPNQDIIDASVFPSGIPYQNKEITSACARVTFGTPDSLRMFEAHYLELGRKIAASEATGRIEYYSVLRAERREMTFGVVATFDMDDIPACVTKIEAYKRKP